MYYVIVKERDFYTNIRVYGVYCNVPVRYEAYNADIHAPKDALVFECSTPERAEALAAEIVGDNPKATVMVAQATTAFKAERPNIKAISISDKGELPT